jgi:uncharacterized protein (DUF4415 family)
MSKLTKAGIEAVDRTMRRLPEPDLTDPDNPEWTAADFARAKPLASLPAPLRAKLKGGRPRAADVKKVVTLRLRASLLAAYEAQGPGWRARMEQILIEGLKRP